MRAVTAAGEGEVRAGHAAGVAEAVAGEAGGGAEDLAALGEVPVLHAGLRRGAEFVERPVLRRAAGEHGADVIVGRLYGRILGEGDELLVSGEFLRREGREAVVTDELDELAEARAAAVAGGLDEPVELGFAQGGRPAGLEHAHAAHDLELGFLAAGIGDEGHGLGGEGGGLEVTQGLGQQPVQLELGGGVGGVVLGDDRGDAGGVGIAVAVQDDLGQAHVQEFLLLGELREVVGAERGEQAVAERGFRGGRRGGRRRDAGARVRLGGALGMVRALGGLTRQREERFQAGGGVLLGEGAFGPAGVRLVLEHDARGEAQPAVRRRKVRPGGIRGGGVLLAMEFLEGLAGDDLGGRRRCLVLDGVGRFLAGVGHAVEAGLDLAAADGEVHRAVLRVDQEVGDGQRGSADEVGLGADIARALGLEVDGVDLAPAPIHDEERFLILGGELRAVTEGDTGGRAGADVHGGGQVVRIEFRVLAGAVAPAVFAAADDVVDAGRAIPRGVEVVLHVGVVREQVAGAVDGAAVDVAEAAGEGLEGLPVLADAVDDAARGEHVAVMAAAVRHAGQEMVVAPERRDGRGGGGLGLDGVVAGDQVEALLVLGDDDLVDAVVAAGFDRAQQLDLVDLIVAVAVAQSVEAARDLLLVVVDAGVKRAEGPDHAVDGADVDRHLPDVGRLERLAGGRGGEAVEVAVLVAGVDAAFVVGAKRDPGSLDVARDGIEELYLESGRGLDAVDRRGFVLADRLAGIGVGRCLLGRSLGRSFVGLRSGLLGRRRHDALGVARDLVLLEGEQGGFGQFFEDDILDLDDHRRAFVHLESEQAFEGAVLRLMVDEVDGDFAVDLMDEVVALRDDDVLVPLGEIDLHGVAFGGEPLVAFVVDDDALAVLDEDAASALFVDHAVVRGVGVDVALVAADDPLADLGQLLAAILDAGVAGGAFDLGA